MKDWPWFNIYFKINFTYYRYILLYKYSSLSTFTQRIFYEVVRRKSDFLGMVWVSNKMSAWSDAEIQILSTNVASFLHTPSQSKMTPPLHHWSVARKTLCRLLDLSLPCFDVGKANNIMWMIGTSNHSRLESHLI